MSRTVLWLNIALSLLAITVSSWALVQVNRFANPDRIVETRGLLVRDSTGQVRIALGAPVQNPVVRGVTGKRVAPASGMLLFGPDGNERGGYLTVDKGGEAVLTLDSQDGSTEVFKVVANPDAGASLFVLHRNSAGAMLTTYQGHPELRLVDSSGDVTFSQPKQTNDRE